MKLVVGLGNPGQRYRFTRHNVGVRVVEALAARAGVASWSRRFQARFAIVRIQGVEVGLLLPETWMNASGQAVAEALAGLPLQDPARDLLVVLDDADLPPGRLRLRGRGGDGGHRGLRDVLERIGGDVPRLRFGVGRPPPGVETPDHVLEPFSPEEEAQLATDWLSLAADAVACFLVEGVEPAMNRFNPAAPTQKALE